MTTPQNTKAITVSEYMRKPESIARFAEVLGDKNASPYIQSVLIAVSASEDLIKCTPQSVMRSALRAASLGLSCDPALKQAWIVPYNKKNRDGTWSKEAQFQPHYKGLYTLAMRTGKYWQINVSPVYEGQKVFENTLTGLHVVQEEGGIMGKPDSFNAAYKDVTVRRKANQVIIGWIGYFKTKKGFEKSVWMSTAEIEDHARKYVRDYDKNPNWNDADKRQVMEMKTVLRQLLSWADMSGTENTALVEALQEDATQDEPITVQAETVTENTPTVMTIEMARGMFNPYTKAELGTMTTTDLNALYVTDEVTEEMKEAIALVLKIDFSMEPPAKPKPSQNQMSKELGF